MPCKSLTAIIIIAAAGLAAAAEPAPLGFEGAKWIWSSSDAARSAEAGSIYVRAEFNVSEQSLIKTAELIATADNLYTVYLNGKMAGESSDNPNEWNKPKRFDVAKMLQPGNNLIAIEAINTVPGPAGLIVKLKVVLNDGFQVDLASGPAWKCTEKEEANWNQPTFDDNPWRAAAVVAEFGAGPWRTFKPHGPLLAAGESSDPASKQRRAALVRQKAEAKQQRLAAPTITIELAEPAADFRWPEGFLFLGDDNSLYRPPQHTAKATDSLSVTVFNARESRAYPEHDLPSPIKTGRKLYSVSPLGPGAKPKLLLDAGQGAIGTPCVSFDGRSILVAMAKDGERFYHIYRLPIEGGQPVRLTDGPFHDIDPTEMPDGRIVFTSTRIGLFEEYHNPPSRALFVMSAEGREIHPITNTFIFDNESRILADGRIVFIRSDNFFDRGKVETLLHAVHPDGTEGYTEFGLENGPEYGGRLRAFYCGSPAPMPDGRLAFVSSPGITLGRLGSAQKDWRHFRLDAGDVAATVDGRLLCTIADRVPLDLPQAKKSKKARGIDMVYNKIGLIDPNGDSKQAVVVYRSEEPIHSVVAIGARPRPPIIPEKVDPQTVNAVGTTGTLFCHDARLTKNNTAGWPHVRAIRVLAGKGLNVRSSHSYIVHAGTEVVELGTVPLAPDGSFCIEVPADTAIAFQAVDAEGRSELNEMSWIYVRPGEQRSCIGCHQSRQATPPFAATVARASVIPPLKMLGQGPLHRFRGNNPAVTGLMELQFDRYREIAGLNRHAETGDTLANGPKETAMLAERVAEPGDEATKIALVQRLGLSRDRTVWPALAKCLTEPSRELRVAAAVAMAACGTRESVPALLSALEDADPLVAQAAAMALENLTCQAQPFDGFAPYGERCRQAQAWRDWFAQNDWAAIEARLVAQLGEDDRDRQRRAAVALGHVGSDAARTALRNFVAVQREFNPYPEWKASHQGDGTRFNSLAPVNPRTLQEAARAIGYLRDPAAVPLLADTLAKHSDPKQSNLFLAEAVAESLGRIGTPQAEAALAEGLTKLQDYFHYVGWYGDHPALFACHSSPVHHFIAQGLDTIGSTQPKHLVPNLIRSVPTDVDRALFPPNDDCETLIGRVIRRLGREAETVETCLAILGDSDAKETKDIGDAIRTVYQAWGGKPDPENRAAHILSLTCRDGRFEPRIRAAFERYRKRPNDDIPRVFDTGIPVVQKLPIKNWTCFFLARSLGNLADARSADALIAALAESPVEAASGRPDPTGPGVLFLHNDLTPCWRAAVAWALGRVGDKKAVPVLLKIVGDLDNSPDTRHTAAESLGRIADPTSLAQIRRLAANYPDFSVRRSLLRAAESMPATVTAR